MTLTERIKQRNELLQHMSYERKAIRELYTRLAIWQQRYRLSIGLLERIDNGLKSDEFEYYTRYGKFPSDT